MAHKIVIYHKDCLDGFGGAWVAWKKFGNKAEYIGEKHGVQEKKNLAGKDVYFIDFSYPQPQIDKIIKEANSLTMIDHHISAKDVVKSVPNHLYALNHSGATLAWKYFFPMKKIPKLLLHIEDVDLWKFKLKGTREIISMMEMYPFDFKIWNKITKELESKSGIKKYIENGKLILQYKEILVSSLAEKADKAKLGKYSAIVVNSGLFNSEIGNVLVKKGADIGIVYSEQNGIKKVSLRSGSDKVDVSKIAEKFGGGGHKRAAGFIVKEDEKEPWTLIKNK